MKKIYLSLLTVMAGLSLQAQLTQANQAPTATYTFQLYQCDSTAISPGATGANASWNFASIGTHSSVLSNYMTSAVSGNANYPNATAEVAASASNTAYYNSSSTELDYYGGNLSIGNVSALLVYTTPAVVAKYPMSLSTTGTSTISGNVTVMSVSGTFTGNASVIADGTGTLTLPGTNTTFTNAIRVLTSQTLNVTSAFATATVTQINYDYYSVGIRNPIFSINTATLASAVLGTSNQTLVTRDKNATAVQTATTNTVVNVGIAENTANTFNLNVYPNPSSSYVQFVSDSQDTKLTVSVYDITGKLIDRQNFAEGKAKLDVSDVNTGLYIYTVSGSNNRSLKTGKITVNH